MNETTYSLWDDLREDSVFVLTGTWDEVVAHIGDAMLPDDLRERVEASTWPPALMWAGYTIMVED